MFKSGRADVLKVALLLAFVSGMTCIALLWHLAEIDTVDSLEEMISRVRSLGVQTSFFTAVCVLTVASVIAVPLGLIFVISAALFGPYWGLLYAMISASAGGAINFALGGYLGHTALCRMAGDRVNRISHALAKRGILSVIVLRMLPIAPFAVVNLVAGTTHIRLGQFLIGSIVGMLPGGVLFTYFSDSLLIVAQGVDVDTVLAVLVGALLLVTAVAGIRRWMNVK